MISDLLIAENIKKLISKRDKNDTHISIENKVLDGVRYITFTGMDNETFRESFTWTAMIAEILGMDKRRETFANPHFIYDWEHIKHDLLKAIDDEGKTLIVLSGHGVAGSIALIAGYYLTMHHKNLMRVVTFGAPAAFNPRKTNDGFLYPLNLMTTQYVFARDPIASMFKWTKYRPLKEKIELNIMNCDRQKLSIDCYLDSAGVESK